MFKFLLVVPVILNRYDHAQANQTPKIIAMDDNPIKVNFKKE